MQISTNLIKILSPPEAPLLFEPPAEYSLREQIKKLPPVFRECASSAPGLQNTFYFESITRCPAEPFIDEPNLLEFHRLVKTGEKAAIRNLRLSFDDMSRFFDILFFTCRLAPMSPRNFYLGYVEGRDEKDHPNQTYLRYLGVLPSANQPIHGVVSLYPGYGQGLDSLTLLIEALVAAGCAVFSYDDIGVGRSSPRRFNLTGFNAGPVNLNNTALFNRWVKQLHDTHPHLRTKPWLGIAHCMGGTHLLTDGLQRKNSYGFGALWFINPIWHCTSRLEEIHDRVLKQSLQRIINEFDAIGKFAVNILQRPSLEDPETKAFFDRLEGGQELHASLAATLAYRDYFQDQFATALRTALKNRDRIPPMRLYRDPQEALSKGSERTFETIKRPTDCSVEIQTHYGPFMANRKVRQQFAADVCQELNRLTAT